jgi:hypothetical protein
MKTQNMKVVVASDVNTRDGIGTEIYLGDELIIEIFRDDTKKSREVTLYKKDVSLELLEESFSIFKKKIPWDFIEYDEPDSEK